MARRKRSPFGNWSFLAILGLLWAERHMERDTGRRAGAQPRGWHLIARELLLRRLGFYTTPGIALRLAAYVVRRFFGRDLFGGRFAGS